MGGDTVEEIAELSPFRWRLNRINRVGTRSVLESSKVRDCMT
jgi:hypothetical protein